MAIIITFLIILYFVCLWWDMRDPPARKIHKKRSTAPYIPRPIDTTHLPKSELDPRAMKLKRMLLRIYKPKYPFRLAVSNRQPPRRLGTYFTATSRIMVYKNDPLVMREVAIHELAHHVTDTEVGNFPRCHDKHFKQTYTWLIDKYNQTQQPYICPDTRYYLRQK